MKSFSQFIAEKGPNNPEFFSKKNEKGFQSSQGRTVKKRTSARVRDTKAQTDALSNISKTNKVTSSQQQTAKNVLDNLKKYTSPDQPSTQLKGETKETMFRKGQAADTGDTSTFRRNASRSNTKTQNKVVVTKNVTKPPKGEGTTRRSLNQTVNKVTTNVTKPPKGQQLTDIDLTKKVPLRTAKPEISTPKVTQNITEPKKGSEISFEIDKNKTQKPKPKLKPRTRTKVSQFTTQPKSALDLPGFLKRGAERTGIIQTEPKTEVKGKLKNIPKSKVTKTVLKQTPKSLRAFKILGGLGRIAGGAYAVKDFIDTAKKEKALGRSKTAARLAGASKALGGYIGGGVGALAGGLAGGGVGSLVTGTAGGIAGYNVGSKIGDQIYRTGRNLVTGKKTFKQIRKDINKGIKNVGTNFVKPPSER